AIRSLLAAPAKTVPFLRNHVREALLTPPAQVAQLMTDLGSDRFVVRDQARRGLLELGQRAEVTVRKALPRNPPLELQHRLDRTLETIAGPLQHKELLRQLRAVETLERIGNAEARAVLASLGKGDPEARLTLEAKNALNRLSKQAVASR